MSKLRKAIVYRDGKEQEISLGEVKKGEKFRMVPASEGDFNCPPEDVWFTAVSDGYCTEDLIGVIGTVEVDEESLEVRYAKAYQDMRRLDFLEAQGEGEPWIARLGNGYRLQNTSQEGSSPTAREAIDKAMKERWGSCHTPLE